MRVDAQTAVIITGGASGLGEATARSFAGDGAKVALFDLNEERGTALASELGCLYCNVDVTDDASVDAGLEKARAAHGQENVLVNCAGIAIGVKTASRKRDSDEVFHHPLDSFSRVIDINLIGTFRMIAKCAAGMLTSDPAGEDAERGVIINTASVAAQDGQIGQVAYAASKAGVAGMTLPVARDLSRDGIRVCTIMPGLFYTPMFDTLPDEVQAALAASVPFPSRLGKASEYAALARHIVDNPMLNGESIRLDGAIRLAPK